MRIDPFELERFQSEWEHRVRCNLSESGVRPLSVRQLLGEAPALANLLDAPLAYTQTNGTPALRETIASAYPGATADHVQVTNGGSEANFVVTWRLVEPGDEVVVQVPAYHVTRQLAAGTLVEVLAGFRAPPLPLTVLYPQNRHLSPRVRVFIDWLAELFADPEL